jgi:hypothetical protein
VWKCANKIGRAHNIIKRLDYDPNIIYIFWLVGLLDQLPWYILAEYYNSINDLVVENILETLLLKFKMDQLFGIGRYCTSLLNCCSKFGRFIVSNFKYYNESIVTLTNYLCTDIVLEGKLKIAEALSIMNFSREPIYDLLDYLNICENFDNVCKVIIKALVNKGSEWLKISLEAITGYLAIGFFII